MIALLNSNAKTGEASSGGENNPPMWDKLKSLGETENFSKTMHVDGATVHMQHPPKNTITRDKIEAVRIDMQKQKM